MSSLTSWLTSAFGGSGASQPPSAPSPAGPTEPHGQPPALAALARGPPAPPLAKSSAPTPLVDAAAEPLSSVSPGYSEAVAQAASAHAPPIGGAVATPGATGHAALSALVPVPARRDSVDPAPSAAKEAPCQAGGASPFASHPKMTPVVAPSPSVGSGSGETKAAPTSTLPANGPPGASAEPKTAPGSPLARADKAHTAVGDVDHKSALASAVKVAASAPVVAASAPVVGQALTGPTLWKVNVGGVWFDLLPYAQQCARDVECRFSAPASDVGAWARHKYLKSLLLDRLTTTQRPAMDIPPMSPLGTVLGSLEALRLLQTVPTVPPEFFLWLSDRFDKIAVGGHVWHPKAGRCAVASRALTVDGVLSLTIRDQSGEVHRVVGQIHYDIAQTRGPDNWIFLPSPAATASDLALERAMYSYWFGDASAGWPGWGLDAPATASGLAPSEDRPPNIAPAATCAAGDASSLPTLVNR
jgi:hypothetical protein